jgi:hypothetical protein
MTVPRLTGHETAEELLFLGAALAHVAAYREHERRARRRASDMEAIRLFVTRNPAWGPHLLGLRAGTLGLAPVVVRDGSVGA